MLRYIDHYLFTAPTPVPSSARYRIIVDYMIKQLTIWELANHRQDYHVVQQLYPYYKDDPFVIHSRYIINGDIIAKLLPQYIPNNIDALITTVINLSYSMAHYNIVKLLLQYTSNRVKPTQGYYSLSQTVPDKYALEFATRFGNIEEVQYCLTHTLNVKYKRFSMSIGNWIQCLGSCNIAILRLVDNYFYETHNILAALLAHDKVTHMQYNEDAACLLMLRRHDTQPVRNHIKYFDNLIGLMTVMNIDDEEILYVLQYSSQEYITNIKAPQDIKHRLHVLSVGAGLLPISVMDSCPMCENYTQLWDMI